jgi:hypothetical protein
MSDNIRGSASSSWLRGARIRDVNSEEEEIIELFQKNMAKFACVGLTNVVDTVARATREAFAIPEENPEHTRALASEMDYLSTSGVLTRSLDDRLAGKHDQPCTVCMENAAVVLYLPCAHLICCGRCSELLTECPTCRTTIDHKIPTYNNAS